MPLQRGQTIDWLFSLVDPRSPFRGVDSSTLQLDHLSERDRSIGEGPSVCQLCSLIDLRSPISGIDRSERDRSVGGRSFGPPAPQLGRSTISLQAVEGRSFGSPIPLLGLFKISWIGWFEVARSARGIGRSEVALSFR
ncbi:uncharacterized protein G2W53_032785 [Senna tora]|uniref:Uncharacterized protein n=1 Tax=Senna tora TaxID=362788 RepID=A0A834SXB9_9FABA|nr:uncharacterized protein G2W53_032785 [Senna tora]